MKPKLQLYVWEDFMTDYTSGLAVAIAATEEQAKEQILKAWGYTSFDDWGTLTIYPLNAPMAVSVCGGG